MHGFYPRAIEPRRFATDAGDPAFAVFRTAEATGRPFGTAAFVRDLEKRSGRRLARRAPGRKPLVAREDQEEML